MKKKFFAALFIIILLGGNLGMCTEFKNTETNNCINVQQADNLESKEIKNLIITYKSDIIDAISKEDSVLSDKQIKKILKKSYYLASDAVIKWTPLWSTPQSGDFCLLDLPDENYLKWLNTSKNDVYEPVEYAIEYSKKPDYHLTGLIKQRKLDENKYAFYEYKIDKTNGQTANLHRILVYINNNHTLMAFTVTADGVIKGLRYKDKVFLPEIDVKNLENTNTFFNDDFKIKSTNIAEEHIKLTGFLSPVTPFIIPVYSFIGYYYTEKALQAIETGKK